MRQRCHLFYKIERYKIHFLQKWKTVQKKIFIFNKFYFFYFYYYFFSLKSSAARMNLLSHWKCWCDNFSIPVALVYKDQRWRCKNRRQNPWILFNMYIAQVENRLATQEKQFNSQEDWIVCVVLLKCVHLFLRQTESYLFLFLLPLLLLNPQRTSLQFKQNKNTWSLWNSSYLSPQS